MAARVYIYIYGYIYIYYRAYNCSGNFIKRRWAPCVGLGHRLALLDGRIHPGPYMLLELSERILLR